MSGLSHFGVRSLIWQQQEERKESCASITRCWHSLYTHTRTHIRHPPRRHGNSWRAQVSWERVSCVWPSHLPGLEQSVEIRGRRSDVPIVEWHAYSFPSPFPRQFNLVPNARRKTPHDFPWSRSISASVRHYLTQRTCVLGTVPSHVIERKWSILKLIVWLKGTVMFYILYFYIYIKHSRIQSLQSFAIYG